VQAVAKATFAAGCFWGVEDAFRQVKGVTSAMVGYTGGSTKNPTYKDVCTGRTGHAEAVEVEFDSSQVSYRELLAVFFQSHDPTTMNRQGPDFGTQYRSAIFFHDETQKRLAEASRAEVQKRFKQPVVTEITPASTFWRAEEYHQDYYKKNPLRYNFYRSSCGRDHRLEELWGKSGE
jgi:peptide-methionine (S)-S-oxide reductase